MAVMRVGQWFKVDKADDKTGLKRGQRLLVARIKTCEVSDKGGVLIELRSPSMGGFCFYAKSAGAKTLENENGTITVSAV